MRLFTSLALLLLFSTAAQAKQPFDLPFHAEDIPDDQRWYWGRAIHSKSGVQKHGYDLDVRKYDGRRWNNAKHKRNKGFYVYGVPIYAMEAGTVIACWRNAPENPRAGATHSEITKYEGKKSRIYGGGNGFWIEHADGSRAEYAHFIPGTVPASLCPHNDKLLPKQIASPAVKYAWPYIRVPKSAQVKIRRGQFLGKVGNAGTSSAPHLHIHLEKHGKPVPINFKRGLSAPEKTKPFGKYTSFAGRPIPPGKVLIWPPRKIGKEYTRFALPSQNYQAFFDHLADSGGQPEWLDFYSVNQQSFVNMIWRERRGPWQAFHLLAGKRYQAVFNAAQRKKLSLSFLDSSLHRGQVRYTAIFSKQTKPVVARHGLDQRGFNKQLKSLTKKGYHLVNASVVSVKGKLRYSTLFRKENVGGWTTFQIPERDYQKVYTQQTRAKRWPTYVNGYVHKGKPHISVVFTAQKRRRRLDRHGLSSKAYQKNFNKAHQSKMLTRTVTAFDGAGSKHRFAGSWWQ